MSSRGVASGGAGAGGAENFPDLHHKMSKKIAQLTKVIYHLNTRNDDHEQEMATLAAQHESEINGILRDAAAKINKFKDALAKQRAAAKEAVTVRMIKEQHEQDKAAFLAQFDEYKRSVKEKERATQTEHAARLRELKRDMDDAKARFKDRMEQFERAAHDIATNSSISSEELDRLKANHQEEVEELVRKYNKQYNDMLHQRLEEEDKLRAELDAENKLACENLSRQFEARLKKYKADAEAARDQLKAASDAAMLRAIDEHKAAISRVLKDLDAAKLEALQNKQDADRFADQNGALEARVDELERELRETRSQLDSLREASGKGQSELRGMLADRDDKIGLLEGQLAMMEGANSQLGQDLTAARNRCEDLQRSLDSTADAKSSTQAQVNKLQAELDARNADLRQLRDQLGQAKSSINGLGKDLEECKSRGIAMESKYGKQVDKLQGEIKALSARLKSSTGTAQSALEAAKEREAELKRAMKAAAAEADKARKAAASEHNKALSAAKSKAAKEQQDAIDAAKAKFQAAQDAAAAKQKAKEEALRNKFESDRAAIARQKEADVARLRKQAEDDKTSLTAKLERLTAECERMKKDALLKSSTVDNMMKKAEEENHELHRAVKKLKEQLRTANEDGKRAGRMVEGLKKQVEELRLEIRDVQKEAQRKIQRELKAAEEGWQKKIKEQERAIRSKTAAEKKEALAALKAQYEAKARAQLNEAGAAHAALLKQLNDTEEAMRIAGERAAKKLAAAQEADQAARAAAAATLEKYKADAAARHEAAVEEGKLNVANTIARLERQKRRELDEQAQLHENNVARINKQHQDSTANLNGEHRQALAALRSEMTEERRAGEAELDRQKQQALEALTKRLNGEHQDAMDQAVRAHNAKAGDLTMRLQDTTSRLEQAIQRGNSLDGQLRDTSASLNDANARIKRLIEENRYALTQLSDSLNEQHKNEMDAQAEEHLQQTEALQDEFRRAQDMFIEERGILQQRCDELEERFKNRESRPEDIDRIRQLAALCAQKDILVRKTQEEMKYFKLELMNREENFNKTFNRKPTVGVMSVVKSNGARGPATIDASGKAKNKGLPPLGAGGGSMQQMAGNSQRGIGPGGSQRVRRVSSAGRQRPS